MPERSAIGGASTTPDTDLASVPRWVLRGMIWFLALAACGGIATAVTLVMILALLLMGQAGGRQIQARNSKRLDRIEATLNRIEKTLSQ